MYNAFYGDLWAVGYTDSGNQEGSNLFALFVDHMDAERFLAALDGDRSYKNMAIYKVIADRNGAFTAVEKI